jgi:hypothetical protein
MYALALILLIATLMNTSPKLPEPYKCPPWDKCPQCHGTGIIELDNNESIECYCTTEWR